MSTRPIVGRGLLVGVTLFLLWLAWQALSGGLRQLHRARTVGQKIETIVQLKSGGLSLLVVLTCFFWRQSAPTVRTLWTISLASAAGLSSLVWGPPMPLVGMLFVAIALLVARAVVWTLHTALES